MSLMQQPSAASGPSSLDVLLSRRSLDEEGGDYSGRMTASEMAAPHAPVSETPIAPPPVIGSRFHDRRVALLGEDAAQPAPVVRRRATGFLAP
jgi:hypothetical protein